MKHVLLICEYFAPQNIIAAIRFTKTVKYLAATGKYHFWVITKKNGEDCPCDALLARDIASVSEYVTVLPVDMDKKLIKQVKALIHKKAKQTGRTADVGKERHQDDAYFIIQEKFVSCRQRGWQGECKRKFGRLLLLLNDLYDLLFEYMFVLKGKKVLKQIPMKKVEIMISSYGQMGAHRLALACKRKKKKLHWIADYRDPVTAATGIVQNYLLYLAEQTDRKADFITGVTDSCIGSGKYPEKHHVICNGYDSDDIRGLTSGRENKKLIISYTGNLYYKKSEMTQLFHIISDLQKEGKVDSSKISVVYAGKQFYILEKQAERYGLKGLIDYRGLVSRQEAVQIQYESDILCALTWNNKGNDNILTGKFLEYFMMHKPVFAIVTGNKPGSMMKRVMEEAELGFCLEECHFRRDYQYARKWFLEKYEEFMDMGCVVCHPKEEILKTYSSQRTAEKFDNLLRTFG